MLCDALQARKVFQHALTNHYAILAVNADSHAAINDCLEAARLIDAPVIIETSLWQIKGHSFGAGNAIDGVAAYLAHLLVIANCERYKSIPVIYHTDHIKGPETLDILRAAIEGINLTVHNERVSLRASTISLDASELNEEQNIAHILTLCEIAKAASVPVTLEMESAVDEGITSAEETKKLLGSIEALFPEQIFLWAPGVGTKHGFGEHMNFSVKTIKNNIRLTKEITGREIGIALHGSTGLSPQDLSNASKAGVVKVNWSTESLLIRSTAARNYYLSHEEKLDKKHPEWKNTVMDNGITSYVAKEYIPKVAERMQILGGVGKAGELVKVLQLQ